MNEIHPDKIYDTEHVGWYYLPVKNGKATWIAPSHNKNINVRMISFVIPLYMSNQTIGVVGMDIDLSVITTIVDGMQLYGNGYAFLANADATVVHHKTLATGAVLGAQDNSLCPLSAELRNRTSAGDLYAYTLNNESKNMAFRPLNNGMRLVVTAAVSEIDAKKNKLVLEISIALIAISIFAILLTVSMTSRLIRPMRELNTAAQKIASGYLSVTLTRESTDEVGMLAESFQLTVEHLQKYISYINGLAHRNSLTGVKNKTAYQESEKRLEEQMRLGKPEFAIAVLDVNGLKLVNATFGHDLGDMLIINACRIICKTFLHSPVFRIGGDEFVVILAHVDYENYSILLDNFEENINLHNQSARPGTLLSIARGIAVYEYETDLVLANIFKRADEAMYQNKAAMKARRCNDNTATMAQCGEGNRQTDSTLTDSMQSGGDAV